MGQNILGPQMQINKQVSSLTNWRSSMPIPFRNIQQIVTSFYRFYLRTGNNPYREEEEDCECNHYSLRFLVYLGFIFKNVCIQKLKLDGGKRKQEYLASKLFKKNTHYNNIHLYSCKYRQHFKKFKFCAQFISLGIWKLLWCPNMKLIWSTDPLFFVFW